MSALLKMETPAVEVVEGAPSPCMCNDDGTVVRVDAGFLRAFGDDHSALRYATAHELAHCYWLRRDDWATALPGYHEEDSADFTAGQLVAAVGESPIAIADAIGRILARYEACRATGLRRSAEDRRSILLNGYAQWLKEDRVFR